MYDPKSEPREFLADSLAEATAKATSWFGLEASALAIRCVFAATTVRRARFIHGSRTVTE